MNNTSDVWLNIEEVCSLTNSKKETIRRKCKSGEYKCRFELAGRNKNYQILLSSMPLKYIEKYKSYLTPTSQNEVEQSLEAYSNAPKWMKAKAEKYLELFRLTEGMTYQEKLDFLADWSQKYPHKKACYSSLTIALKKYSCGGITALLSHYGNHRKGFSKVDNECFEYFKSIYLREGAPSVETAWSITLGFAKRQGFDCVSNFPTSKRNEFKAIRICKKTLPKQWCSS